MSQRSSDTGAVGTSNQVTSIPPSSTPVISTMEQPDRGTFSSSRNDSKMCQLMQQLDTFAVSCFSEVEIENQCCKI